MSVVTVTPAGTIDLTYRLDALRPGRFVRASSAVREISGKGVNVAVAAATGGMPSAAVVVLGADDASLAAASPHSGLLRPFFVPGQTRVSTQIVDADAVMTKINAPVVPMTGGQWRELVAAASAAAGATARWLVVGGSLPPVDGRPPDLRSLLSAAPGARVTVDTSGEALTGLLAEPDGIDLVKPNVHELSDALGGIPLRTVGDVVAAARTVIARGVSVVCVSMGPDGMLAVARNEVVHAWAPAARIASTAGAGDAALAGFLLGAGTGESLDLVAGCTLAAQFGALAVSRDQTLLTSLAGLPAAVTTVDPDRHRVLEEPADPAALG